MWLITKLSSVICTTLRVVKRRKRHIFHHVKFFQSWLWQSRKKFVSLHLHCEILLHDEEATSVFASLIFEG